MRRHGWLFSIPLCALIFSACSSSRDAQTKVLDLQAKDASAQSGELTSETPAQMRKLFDLYTVGGKLSPEQITKLIHNFFPTMDDFTKLTLSDQPSDKYTFEEFWKKAERNSTVLSWLKYGPVKSKATLAATLTKAFPGAHAELVNDLAGALTLDWSAQSDATARSASLMSHGVILAKALKAKDDPSTQNFVMKLGLEKLWLLHPEITSATEDDRKVALALFALDATTDPLSGEQAAANKMRDIHRGYFKMLSGRFAKAAPLDFDRLETADWNLLTSLSGRLKEEAPVERSRHFKETYMQLASQWGEKAAYFDGKVQSENIGDLFIAGATDDLIAACALTKDRTLDKDFVEIFLFRVEKASEAAISDQVHFCHDVTGAYHPTFAAYNMWRLKLAVSFSGELLNAPDAAPTPFPVSGSTPSP